MYCGGSAGPTCNLSLKLILDQCDLTDSVRSPDRKSEYTATMNNNKGANRLLLDSGDEDDEKIEFNENSGYAKRYDDWREKEEMQKRKSLSLVV